MNGPFATACLLREMRSQRPTAFYFDPLPDHQGQSHVQLGEVVAVISEPLHGSPLGVTATEMATPIGPPSDELLKASNSTVQSDRSLGQAVCSAPYRVSRRPWDCRKER